MDRLLEDLRRATDLLDEEWPQVSNGVALPEYGSAVPWPVRNYIRRVRAALATVESSPEREGGE